MDWIKKFLSDISLWQWCIVTLICLAAYVQLFWRYLKSQWRYARNLKRKVYFLATSTDGKLQTPKGVIKNINLFRVDNEIKDISNQLDILQTLDSNAVYIVSYDENFDFASLIKKAADKKIPVIIFARQGEIKNADHFKIFNDYIFCDIVNTTKRIAVILMAMFKIV